MTDERANGADAFRAFEHEGWEGGVRTRGLLRAQTPGALAAIREAARCAAAAHAPGDGEGVEFAMPAVLASGVKA